MLKRFRAARDDIQSWIETLASTIDQPEGSGPTPPG
jgi:hypothetical protein